MAEEKPKGAIDLQPLALTISEMLGALLPGFVWLILFSSLWAQFQGVGWTGKQVPPIWVLNHLYEHFTKLERSELSPILWIAIIASLLIGWSIKPIVMRLSDVLLGLFSEGDEDGNNDEDKEDGIENQAPAADKQRTKSKRVTPKRKYLKGFDQTFMKLLRRKINNALVTEETNKNMNQTVVSGDPQSRTGAEIVILPVSLFPICRRIVRVISPPLWAELERREAEGRMIGSLFLASASSFLSAIIWLLTPHHRAYADRNWWFWTIISLLFGFILRDGLQYLRKREVQFAFLNFLIALAERNKKFGTAQPEPLAPSAPPK